MQFRQGSCPAELLRNEICSDATEEGTRCFSEPSGWESYQLLEGPIPTQSGHPTHPGTFPTLCIEPLVRVHLVGEGMAQGDGGEKHLHADDEVLVAGGHRALTHGDVGRVDFGDGATLLQDGQEHP